MIKKIYDKMDKQAITQLPQVTFPGRIVTILTEGEAGRAVDYLLTHRLLGIDSETRPAFKRGQRFKVSLLQVSTSDVCFLFRLCRIGLPPCLVRLLENKEVPLVGLSLNNDILSLHERAKFKPGCLIDLQDVVGEIGIVDQSLQKIYANIFGEKISKRQRLSNWDADVLTDRQREYAAIDAWACLRLYEEIGRLKATGEFELIHNMPTEGGQ